MTSFGGDLYDALREDGHGWLLARQLGFSNLQELKQADRAQALRLLRGTLDYEEIQRLKVDSPEEFARFWVHREELRAQQRAAVTATGGSLYLFMMAMLGGGS